MAGSKQAWRDRAFHALARWGTQQPWRVLGVIFVVLLGFAVTLPGLSVTTSRTNMVSDEDPQQRRQNEFHERFGRPDYPLFVVSGGTDEQRRAVVDALTAQVETHEELRGRTFGRVEPREVASILLLQQPAALAQLETAMPPGVEGATFVESGLQGWLTGLAEQVEAGLDGGGEAQQDPSEAAEGLQQLADLAGVLEAVLRGEDPMGRFEDQMPLSREGIDARGYVVTADGQHHLLAIYADVPSDEGRVLAPLVETLREARDTVMSEAPEGVTARLTGLPALAVDELEIVEQGLMITSVAATIGIFGLCLLLFRSLRQTIVALLPLAPGILGTLAVVRLLYDDLNIITSGFVAVLLGLGIDFSVHIIARRNEEIRLGRTPTEAIALSLRRTGPGIFTGAVVTSAAFLTNISTEFTAYGELGVVTAVGLLLMVLITFAVIPPLLTVGKAKDSDVRIAPEPPGLASLPGVIRKGKLLLLAAGIALAVFGGLSISSLEYNTRYFDFLPESTESAQGLSVLEYDALASPVFAAIPAESIEAARQKAAQLRALDSVAGVQTPSDLLPPLDDAALGGLRKGLEAFGRTPDVDVLARAPIDAKTVADAAEEISGLMEEVAFALRSAGKETDGADAAKDAYSSLAQTVRGLDEGGRARLLGINAQAAAILGPALETAAAVAQRGHYLPSDLPPLFATRFVSNDGEDVALFVVPSGQFWEEEVALRFADEVRGVDEDAVGLAMVHVHHGRQVRDGFERAALYAAGIIVLLLVLDFRSIKDALLALAPTVLGWLWMLGLMPLVGLNFNVANIVALPLVLGIGIAFGVHMLHRLREGAADERPTLDGVVRGTGGAIGVAATTTMVGFAALMLSPYGGMVSLGATMVLGIGSCLLATLLVLPAILLLVGEAH